MTARRLTMALLLLMAFVIVPVGGTHLHFCFDGQEPPVSVHLADTDDHHGPVEATGGHEDLDVSLVGDALGKKFDRSLDDALPVRIAFAPFAERSAAGVWIPRASDAPVTPFLRSEILPPLRGPPV